MNIDSKMVDVISAKIVAFLPSFASSVLFFVVGWICVNLIAKLLTKYLKKKKIDVSLRKFLTSILTVSLKILVLISTLGMLGVKTSSFLAIIGSAGLAIGLALQGSLSNFAGGVLILVLRPFKAGDFIEAQGFSGTVVSVNIFTTKLKTPDNKIIHVPNAPLANGSIVNITEELTRRVDWVFGVSYEDDLKKAKDVIFKTICEDSRVLEDPAPFIAVSALADNCVEITVRVWALKENYWPVYFDNLENVKLALDQNKISIPYPQRQLHITQNVIS